MVAKKSALGRGLGALIDDADQKPEASINEVRIGLIEVNPFQPRTTFDEESLRELAASISELGIIQPITVRQVRDEKYQLITGERRLRAAKIAGLKTIPAYIRKADDQAMLEMALVENIQRQDLDPIEVAISYQRLIEECSLTQENLSERVGMKRSTISNYLRLLKLPAEIQLGLRHRELSMGHARTIVNIEDPGTQLKVYRQILDEDLSVRKIEELVRKLKETKEEPGKKEEKKKEPASEEYQKLENQLGRFFDTPVQFKRNTKGRGRIVINFNSDDQLERIISKLDQLER